MRLNDRLSFRVGLLPTVKPSVSIAASETDEGGRWFSASFGLKEILGIAGLALTLTANHVSTQNDLARLRERVDAQDRQLRQVVPRQEIEELKRHEAEHFATTQTQQLQIYSYLLNHPAR